MPDINWGPVGQWFSGAVALIALLYVLFRDQIMERLKRPRLIVGFDMLPGYVDQCNVRIADGTTLPGPSRWVRIQVHSEVGRQFVKNCRAFLVGIVVPQPDGRAVEAFQQDVRQLQWMHGNFQQEARDLMPGPVHQIDLVAALEVPTPEQGLAHFLSIRVNPALNFGIPGRYVFTIQVTSENADPVGIEVTVDWGGSPTTLCPVSSRLL